MTAPPSPSESKRKVWPLCKNNYSNEQIPLPNQSSDKTMAALGRKGHSQSTGITSMSCRELLKVKMREGNMEVPHFSTSSTPKSKAGWKKQPNRSDSKYRLWKTRDRDRSRWGISTCIK